MNHPEQVIRPLDETQLAAFTAYLEDHVEDSGRDQTPLFLPRSRADTWPVAEKVAQFRAGLATPVGEPRWRRGWLALDPGGAIRGHIDLRAHPDPCTSHRALLGMGVHRGHRGQGLGRALVTFAVSWAITETTLEWIDLHFLTGNVPAERLYKSAGFREIATVKDMFRIDGRSVHDTLMSLRLRP